MLAHTSLVRSGVRFGQARGFRIEADPSFGLADPLLCEILDYWESVRRGGALPSRDSIDPVAMRDWLPHIALIDIEEEPRRLRWRLIGTHITETLGRDNTGKWFDEIYKGEILANMTAAYAATADARAPMRFTGVADFAHKAHIAFEAVHLPLGDASGRVNMLMIGVVFAA